MENNDSPRQEQTRGKSTANKYVLFDEKTINFFLYGNKEVRVIDVNKLKRKDENEQGKKFVNHEQRDREFMEFFCGVTET